MTERTFLVRIMGKVHSMELSIYVFAINLHEDMRDQPALHNREQQGDDTPGTPLESPRTE